MTWLRDRGLAKALDQHRTLGRGRNTLRAEDALRAYIAFFGNKNLSSIGTRVRAQARGSACRYREAGKRKFEASKNQNPCTTEDASEGGST